MMARSVAVRRAVPFRNPCVQPLDLCGIKHALDFGRRLLDFLLQVRMYLRPCRFDIGLVRREDLLYPRRLVRRKTQLSAELGEHFLMVTGDVVACRADSRIRGRTEDIAVQSTTDDDAQNEGRGNREERA